METPRRGTDGRRLFSAAFKREQISRVLRQELTLAELSRELSVEPSVVRRWQRLVEVGSTVAVAADEDVVPLRELRAAQQQIRELERALGKKTMEVEILQAARDEVKKSRATMACPRDDASSNGPDLSRAADWARECVSAGRRPRPALRTG